MNAIAETHARQILDSRGDPTVKVEVRLDSGQLGRVAVPAGSSTGRLEAAELRDGGERWSAMGVGAAVEAVRGEIAATLRGHDPHDQSGVDGVLIALDGTREKARLGVNAMLATSLAHEGRHLSRDDRRAHRPLSRACPRGWDGRGRLAGLAGAHRASGAAARARRGRFVRHQRGAAARWDRRGTRQRDRAQAEPGREVATGSTQIKAGAPSGERVAKYNRLLRIEEMFGARARFAGLSAFYPDRFEASA